MKRMMVLLAVACSLAATTFDKRPITLFVYIAGDNSLGEYVQQDLDEMRAGAHDGVHVCACINKKTGSQKFTEYVYMTPEGMKVDGPILHNVDSGDVHNAIKAAQWAAETFPCDTFIMDFWDHGSGALNPKPSKQIMRGVCWDDTTGHYLNDFDIRSVIQAINTIRGKKTEIVAFDACLMAGLEVIYSLKDLADYAVLSEETIGALGYQYTYILDAFTKSELTPDVMAKIMIDSYDRAYHDNSNDYTLSAIDLAALNDVVRTFNDVAKFLYNVLDSSNSLYIYHTFEKILYGKAVIRFDERDYADLASLYALVQKKSSLLKLASSENAQLHALLKAASYALRHAVIAHVNSPQFNGAGGISIYLPEQVIHSSYKKLHWTKEQPQWYAFLERYFSI